MFGSQARTSSSRESTSAYKGSSSPSSPTTTARLGDNLKYFVFDCRPSKEFDRAHFSLSFHLDPSLLSVDGATEFDEILEKFKSLKKRACLCFMDSGRRKSTNRPIFTLASGLQSTDNDSPMSHCDTICSVFHSTRLRTCRSRTRWFAACEEIVKGSSALRSL